MPRTTRTAPWALIGIVILALWAGSSYFAQPTAPDARSPEASRERAQARDTAASTRGDDRDIARAPRADSTPRLPDRPLPAWLPPEAGDTLQRIARGGPFPHRQDGGVFGNRERRLPPHPRGWYREYTVDTPGSRDRGARRLITGGQPPSEIYYTDDHYQSFRRIPHTEDLR